MEPLKLWLKNKNFVASDFKENRVVWNMETPKDNGSDIHHIFRAGFVDKKTNQLNELGLARKSKILEELIKKEE